MPTYYVKTIQGRDLLIEADRFFLSHENIYIFDNEDGDTIAEVPNSSNILAIVEEEALLGDYEPGYEDDDELCDDCQEAEEQAFANHVWDLIEIYDEHRNKPDATPEPPVPRVYEATRGGDTWWGFDYDQKFVYFSDEEGANWGLDSYKNGERNWSTIPLAEVTEVIQ